MPRALFLAPLVLAAIPFAAHAQDAERYRLERTESGFVRMDMQTGQMSFCEENSGELTCRAASDGAEADADQVKALNQRIDALERRIAVLEGMPPGQGSNALPSEEEFEQTLSFMERFLRRFMGIVKEMEGEDEEPVPDRT